MEHKLEISRELPVYTLELIRRHFRKSIPFLSIPGRHIISGPCKFRPPHCIRPFQSTAFQGEVTREVRWRRGKTWPSSLFSLTKTTGSILFKVVRCLLRPMESQVRSDVQICLITVATAILASFGAGFAISLSISQTKFVPEI
jgi:hypothetical protein